MGLRTWSDTVDSTQSRAIARARAGGVAGDVFLARSQTMGQGRLDHGWVSPAGGVYLSVLAPLSTVAPGLVPIAIGAEIARVLEIATGAVVRVKWPNDLVTVDREGRARKLGGILVDKIEGPLGPIVVVGVGLNVEPRYDAFPAVLRPRVAFLSELSAHPVGLDDLAELLLRSIDSALTLLDSPGGRGVVLARARARLHGRGRPARVDGHPAGIVDGLADDGALWLADEGRRTEVRVGDLVVVEEP